MLKIDFSKIDLENFLVHPHQIAGETCWLIQAKHIGTKWTRDNLIFRSSVWNSEGEPVSLSFKKFFNWGEQPDLAYTPFSTKANGGVKLLEKLDGSTLIISHYKGQQIIRTRGTVDATKMDNGYEIEVLKDRYPDAFKPLMRSDGTILPCSVIFEWVSPVNKIVLNYGPEPDIYLIAIILHEDYSLVPQKTLDYIADAKGFKRPRYFEFGTIKDMLQAIEALRGQEGICCYCNKEQDIRKVKSAWYLALHRMKTELGSYERLVDFYFTQGCPDYQTFYNYIVDNFDFELAESYRGDISRICEGQKEVNLLVASMQAKVDTLKKMPRKDAAGVILQAYGNTNRAGFAFTLLDGKPLKQEDYKKLLYQITKD